MGHPTLAAAPVSVAVADDGSGNHRELQQRLFISAPEGDHFGLTGIAERVRGLGGAVWFERRRGGGVTLRFELPVPMSSSVPQGKRGSTPAPRDAENRSSPTTSGIMHLLA